MHRLQQRAVAVVPPLAGFLSVVRSVSLSPKVVCVMEQDASDNVPGLAAPFEEALHHYAAVFEALHDEEWAAEEHVLLWEEVKDVLERHERLHQWAKRMSGAGFAGVPLSYVAKMEADADAALRKSGQRGYETRGVEGGCLLLCRISGWPLYSISAWRPWPSQGSASGSGSSRQPQLVQGQMASTWTAWSLLLPPPVQSNLTG